MDELIDGLGLGGLQNLCKAYFGNYYCQIIFLYFLILALIQGALCLSPEATVGI